MKALTTGNSRTMEESSSSYIRWFSEIRMHHATDVGIGNANVGETAHQLAHLGINFPDGFSITTHACISILNQEVHQESISDYLKMIDIGSISIEEASEHICKSIIESPIPSELEDDIIKSYADLSSRYDANQIAVIMRSSSAAEDYYTVSLAQRHPTLFNIYGVDELIHSYKECICSLFTEEAITNRLKAGSNIMPFPLSVGVQKMVHSDTGIAGTMLTIDPDTGFPKYVIINAAYGIGEFVRHGFICPDEYRVFKPLLSDEKTIPIVEKTIGAKNIRQIDSVDQEDSYIADNTYDSCHEFALNDTQILQLSHWACQIEHVMDRHVIIEWAIDGKTGEIFIINILKKEPIEEQQPDELFSYEIIGNKPHILLSGLAIGSGITCGEVAIIKNISEEESFTKGSILVTSEINEAWLPLIKKSSAVITDKGGRTSISATICRNLGIPAVLGSEKATRLLYQGQRITIDCSNGEIATIYREHLEYSLSNINITDIPKTQVRRKVCFDSPSSALRWWKLPFQGIGMAGYEDIITHDIGIHPMAFATYDRLNDEDLKQKVDHQIIPFTSARDYYVDKIAKGIARIAATAFPQTTVIRLNRLTSAHYSKMIGSSFFEPFEKNPEMGLRGASRYCNNQYKAAFDLECAAIKEAREVLGFSNIEIAVPFCRTIQELDKTIQLLEQNGLSRGNKGLKIHLIIEVPSNIILIKELMNNIDYININIHALTRSLLCLNPCDGVSELQAKEYTPSVLQAVSAIIHEAHHQGKKINIYGLQRDHHVELIEYFVCSGVDALSFEPEHFVRDSIQIAEIEKRCINLNMQ